MNKTVTFLCVSVWCCILTQLACQLLHKVSVLPGLLLLIELVSQFPYLLLVQLHIHSAWKYIIHVCMHGKIPSALSMSNILAVG